jgi:hypothetical protein
MNVSCLHRVAMVRHVAIQMAHITVSVQRAMRVETVLSTQMTALLVSTILVNSSYSVSEQEEASLLTE